MTYEEYIAEKISQGFIISPSAEMVYNDLQLVIRRLEKENETNLYAYQKELSEKSTVIKFLKKELQKKMSYRQVMKRQYRELKEKYDSLKSNNG